MKRIIIITAMFVAALQISAQSNTRTRNSGEAGNSEAKKVNTQPPGSSRSSEKKTVSGEKPTAVKSTVNTREKTRSAVSSRERTTNTSKPVTTTRKPSVDSSNKGARVAGAPPPSGRVASSPETKRDSRDSYNPVQPRGTAEPVRSAERKNETVPTPPRTTENRSSVSVRGNDHTSRTAKESESVRRTYETPARKTVVRTVYYNPTFVYRPVEYRRVHYPYRAPAHFEIYWSAPMYREYRVLYPDYRYWYYPIGYRIHTITAYDASFYIGEVARVYGLVTNVWYSRNTNEYYLYFGGPYPYQDFSLIVSGNVAKRFSRRPERYFINRYVAVTGLVSQWENKPEMLIRKRNQLEVY